MGCNRVSSSLAVKVRRSASLCLSYALCSQFFCPDGAVYVWNRETGQLIVTLEGHEHGTVNAVAWTVSAQGVPLIASVGDDSTVRIWAPPQED